MHSARTGRLQSAINVTPLVDVVLVLLILFMIVAPRLQAGPNVDLPATDRPPQAASDRSRTIVTLGRDGAISIDGRSVSAEEFAERMRETAAFDPEAQVVLEGDAGLTYGEVEQAMLAVASAGLPDVGLVAERRPAAPAED